MGTILIDKLLSACVKQGASDLHITVGQPPVLRLHGRMQRLKTKVLEPADTLALMKSITPDRCQQEFQETGSARLRLRLRRRGPVPRLGLSSSAATSRWCCGRFPIKMWSMEQLGLPPDLQEPDHCGRAGWCSSRARPARARRTSLAAMVNYLNENVDHHIITIEDPIEF